ncbi:MAG: hypothetical protein IKR49_06190 [Clostridia bacterium]|nr:hypothetical protein [Clostridia bacterium]
MKILPFFGLYNERRGFVNHLFKSYNYFTNPPEKAGAALAFGGVFRYNESRERKVISCRFPSSRSPLP